MNIGDRVRLLKGTEEGLVAKFIDDKIVEIEIEDGFFIPVLKNELVLVAQQEADAFGTKPQPVSKPTEKVNAPDAIRGIFLAFVPINDQRLSLHFINNTAYDLLFSLSASLKNSYEGYAAAKVAKKESLKVTDLNRSDFDKWPDFFIQIMYFRQGIFDLKKPIERKTKFKASRLFKEEKKAPVIEKKAFLYQIDATFKPESIDPEVIRESLSSPAPAHKSTKDSSTPAVVDLHIEIIADNYKQLSRLEILNFQLKTFENSLNKAIINGQDEVVFVHGIGNGLLKEKIYQKLASYPNLDYFDNYNIGKFGNGATLVRIQ